MRRYVLVSILFMFAACAISQVVMLQRRPSVVAAWVPTDISGCTVWLSADQTELSGKADGDLISVWTNHGSFAFALTNLNAGARPLFTNAAQNGKPAILIDGSTFTLQRASTDIGDIVSASSHSSFLVLKQYDNEATAWYFAWSQNDSNRFILSASGSSYRFYHSSAGGDGLTSGSGVITNSAVLIDMGKNGTTAALIYANGSQLVNDTSVNTNLTTGLTATLSVGVGSSSSFNGWVAEIIIYNRFLTADEFTTVRSKLNEKYGLY